MKEFAKQSKKTLHNIKTFLGDKYEEKKDKPKYASIIDSIEYPEFDEDVEKIIGDSIDKAENLLLQPSPCIKWKRFSEGFIVKQLGKPKRLEHEDIFEKLDSLSIQAARVLAGYEEELELSAFRNSLEDGEVQLGFRIATESSFAEPLQSLLRGVYSQITVDKFIDDNVKYPNVVYAAITIPFLDQKQEDKKQQEKFNLGWLDAVLHSLPGEGCYRATLRIIPLDTNDPEISERQDQLHKIADKLKLYTEADWNQSTSIGANYSRQKNFLGDLGDAIKRTFVGGETVNGNYSDSFGLTRHQKNVYAEQLIQRIEQELYRLCRAKQTKSWKTVLCVEANNEETLQTICTSISGSLKRNQYVVDWGQECCAAAIMSTNELIPLLKFPVKEHAGFEFSENEEFSLSSPATSENGMNIGRVLWNKNPIGSFFLPEQALNRHAFICGMTGSGKTNTLFKLLETADVPFVVIEPVKGEYRSLASKYDKLKIYTMKSDCQKQSGLSILRINPFWFPKNTNIAFHVDSIKTIIASAFEMSNAMPNILEQCMYNIYIKAGWNIVTNKNIYAGTIPEEFLYPTFTDLLDEIEDYLEHSKFVGETLGDYHGAMTTRLKSFVNSYKGLLLNSVAHPDYEQMMNGFSVIELEGLADDADKCLVMGTILVQYFEFLKLNFSITEKKLQHLFVIEEAHRLFKNVNKQTGSSSHEGTSADPAGQLVESLSNIMAEIRAFGEGILIVDQSPSKVSDDVIKNSSTKIVHRIDNENDIKLLQSALLIPDDKTSLPALSQGEALIRTEGMRRPCKVLMHCSSIKEDYHLSDSFKSGDGYDPEMESAFAAMAILSEDAIADDIRKSIWCMLMTFKRDGFDRWKETIDDFNLMVTNLLKEKKRYDLLIGNSDVIRQLVSQSLRQIRSSSIVCIGVNELGAIHLFTQRLFDFYVDACSGLDIKEGNIFLFEKYFVNNIDSLVYEYAQSVCIDED